MVLELAAGVGDTGFEAAAIVGERGRLISTDFSPDMVEAARRRGAALGLRNVHYRVMDAEHIDLDADSVDGVICRFGYMLMPDPAAALSETRRVLQRGARLVLAVWSTPERNPWLTILARILVERSHLPPPEPGAPSTFSLAGEAHTRALLEGAGFTAVRMTEVPTRWAVRDVDDYVEYATDTAGPLAIALRGLAEGERETVKGAAHCGVRPLRRRRRLRVARGRARRGGKLSCRRLGGAAAAGSRPVGGRVERTRSASGLPDLRH